MQTTRPLCGASRLPLTTKRGNKDYYKGTRQSYVPGTSTRTGLPGKHTPHEGGKFRVDDTKVRIFVPPHPRYYSSEYPDQRLTPYQNNRIDEKILSNSLPRLPNLGPSQLDEVTLRTMYGDNRVDEWKEEIERKEGRVSGSKIKSDFAKEYGTLSPAEREKLKVEARRNWWYQYQSNVGLVKDMEKNGFFKVTRSTYELPISVESTEGTKQE